MDIGENWGRWGSFKALPSFLWMINPTVLQTVSVCRVLELLPGIPVTLNKSLQQFYYEALDTSLIITLPAGDPKW